VGLLQPPRRPNGVGLQQALTERRRVFLDTSRAALEFVADEGFARAWDGPSALAEFSLRGLVGHLFRATGSVEAYLDRDEPTEPPIDAATYYNEAVGETNLGSELHRAVRERGEDAAGAGHAALVDEWTALIERLATRLANEPSERLVRVFRDLVLSLDDYLVTRLVELVVHTDDLAASLERKPPLLPRAAFEATISCLVEVARLRHGDEAVVRALARRERDSIRALRVL